MTDPRTKDPRRTGRPKADAPSGSIDLDQIAALRGQNPPLSWDAIGPQLGVTPAAARRSWQRWESWWRERHP